MTVSGKRWPMLEHVHRRAELMNRMMDRVGADWRIAIRKERGAAWYAARSTCIRCAQEERCRLWLEGRREPLGPPIFCPNAAFMTDCRRRSSDTIRQ